MFDIGWQELIVLGAVALVIFPPKEFPTLLKTLIGITNKIRNTTQELQHHIHNFSKTHLEDLSSETKQVQNLIHDSSQRIRKQIEDLEKRAQSATRKPQSRKSLRSKKSPQTSTPHKKLPKTPKENEQTNNKPIVKIAKKITKP